MSLTARHSPLRCGVRPIVFRIFKGWQCGWGTWIRQGHLFSSCKINDLDEFTAQCGGNLWGCQQFDLTGVLPVEAKEQQPRLTAMPEPVS